MGSQFEKLARASSGAAALFAVNTGCRDGEICRLRWEWEEELPGLNASMFVVLERFVKNDEKS